MSLESELSQMLEARDPVLWIDNHIKKNELGHTFTLFDHQRDILRLMFPFDSNGILPYDTLLYSAPKKSGKTSLNAILTLWWSMTQEYAGECYVVANDLEQAQARVFNSIVRLLRHNPEIDPLVVTTSSEIRLSNETVIKALSANYATAAGSNHSWVSYDELWAYVSERNQRLWEEMTAVPTRRNSVRFISTYAGYECESTLLWDLYRQGVDTDEHKEGQGIRLHPELPVYAHIDARQVTYWDHTARMKWQTERYYQGQKRTLRAGTYLRLHVNQWASAESIFITPELWDQCIDPEHRPAPPTRNLTLYAGADVGVKHDSCAIVSVAVDAETGMVILAQHRIWRPSVELPIDLEETLGSYLLDLHHTFTLMRVYADPYQFHRSLTTLQKAGVRVQEYSQTVPNLTRMGQQLYDLLISRNIVLYPAVDLRQQALNTVAVESPRGWRIAKEKASARIDSIIALAMACTACVDLHSRARWLPVGT